MTRIVVVMCLILIPAIILSGCEEGSTIIPPSTLTIAPPESPYLSATSTQIPPTATPFIPTEQPLLPTPTPLKYIVQPGDTLYGIALQNNISLDRLVSANPGVATSLLSVGTELVIPLSAEDDLTVPTPTPYQISISTPYCYSTQSGGSWCIVIAENNQAIPLENLSVAINIYTNNLNLVESHIAIPPLNYINPRQSLPLTTFIKNGLPDSYQANAVLLTSLPDEDYEPNTEIVKRVIEYSDDGKIATITGSINIREDDLKDTQLWIAAVAYNEGIPVGVRKWTSSDPLVPDKELEFEIKLYSLGPPIDGFKLFSELYKIDAD
jgi:LysM repeat protein